MDLRELEAYRLEDAVKFHDELNPRLWEKEQLRPEVREALLRIADDFRQSLGLRELNIRDITVSGSNAAYTYTPHSDIDLHLVVDMPRDDEIYRELFDAKKYQYNDENDFKIGGSDVELYVQDAAKPHASQGIYSVRDDSWVCVPSRRRPTIDDSAVENKYLDIAQRIDQAIDQGDADRMHRLWNKIKDMRRAGLAKTGEFGVENLVFKVLRNNGTIERLLKAQQAIKNREMSLAERRRGRRRKSRNRWGYFGGMWYPGYSYGIGSSEAGSSDGGGDGGGESVNEASVVSMQARRTPLVVFGHPFDWDIYDLRTNKMVANILGGDRRESPLYEIRINRNGMTRTTRMLPTYVLKTGPDNNPPYKAYELEAPSEVDKIEKSPGPGGTTKLKPDTMDVFSHIAKQTAKGRYYGYNMILVEEGLDQYELIEKALGAKIMEVDDAMELGYTDWDPEDTSAIVLTKLATRVTESKVSGSDLEQVLHGFIKACAEYLHMTEMPRVVLIRDTDWTRENGTFGRYNTDTNTLELAINNRHPLDIIRTMAHEMTHARQNEVTEMPVDAGRTGSPYEDEANALAGRFMRHVAEHHPELFRELPLGEDYDPTYNVNEILDKESAAKVYWSKDNYMMGGRVNQVFTLHTAAAQDKNKNILKYNFYDFPKYDLTAVEFSRAVGTEGDSFGIDNAGDQYTVFATLIQAFTEYLRKHDPKYIMFGAKEPSRAKLYQAFINRFASRFGYRQTDPAIIPRPVSAAILTSSDTPFLLQKTGSAKKPVKKPGTREDVYEASGYIPVNDKEARDPRYSMAITQDIRPGETQRQAAKMGWKTDRAGRPPLLMQELRAQFKAFDAARKHKDSNTALSESVQGEILNEVDMSPGALRSWANSDEAKNITAGFEAEMIFRYAQRATDSDDWSDEDAPYPDYEDDPRARSIDDAIEFFSQYNDYTSNSQRDLDRARERLWEEYMEWVDASLRERWDSEKDEQIKEYMEENVWRPEKRRRIESALEDMSEVTDAEAVMNSDADADKELVERATRKAREEFEEEVIEEIDNDMGITHDEAYQAWRDVESTTYDEGDWLRSTYPRMTDVRDAVDLEWPIWVTPEPEARAGRTPEELGQELDSVVPVGSVVVSTGYHSTKRTADRWIMEPDSSIDPDDREDAGWEIVSPPMPLNTALTALRDVVDWARGNGDAYTNRSTGLHMGVSVPSQETVDYVKLILFMGDKHVLEQFGRLSNTYCNSAMDRIQANVKTSAQKRQVEPDVDLSGEAGFMDIPRAMELMRQGVMEIAGKTVKMNVGVDKYTSAHIKLGYIEFRSPGGNYLDQDIDALTNTMLRFARAMSIASDPQAYRKEYAKKLYKLISPQGNDALQLFAAFSTGLLDKDDLKKEWNKIQALRVIQKPRAGADILWSVTNDWSVERMTVRAPTRMAAIDRAIKYSDENNLRWRIADLRAEPQRVVPTTPNPRAPDLPSEPTNTAQALDNRADSQQVQRTVQAPQAGDTWYVRSDRETFELPQWRVNSNAERTQAQPTSVLVRAANAQEALAYAREILGPRFDNVPNEQFTIAPVARAQGDRT
jgi:hypothetical protein